MQVSASTRNRSRWLRFDTPLGSSLSVGTTADSKKIAWVFQIVLVVKRLISELTASGADIDLGKKCPCEVGCPHLRRLGTAIIRIKRESRPKSKPTTRAKRIYSFKLLSLAPGMFVIYSFWNDSSFSTTISPQSRHK